MTETIKLAVLLGHGERAGTAIDELWRRAQSAVEAYDVRLSCVAGYSQMPHETQNIVRSGIESFGIMIPAYGRLDGFADLLTTKSGPFGIMGRLARYNLRSRRLGRALQSDPKIKDIYCSADVIVSADPEADRAVWMLRRSTTARLMHGPFAMANALSEVAKERC